MVLEHHFDSDNTSGREFLARLPEDRISETTSREKETTRSSLLPLASLTGGLLAGLASRAMGFPSLVFIPPAISALSPGANKYGNEILYISYVIGAAIPFIDYLF